VDLAHLTGWESCVWEYVILQNRCLVLAGTILILRTQLYLIYISIYMINVPTAAKITVYCFFSLGTAVKLEKNKKNKKKTETANCPPHNLPLG